MIVPSSYIGKRWTFSVPNLSAGLAFNILTAAFPYITTKVTVASFASSASSTGSCGGTTLFRALIPLKMLIHMPLQVLFLQTTPANLYTTFLLASLTVFQPDSQTEFVSNIKLLHFFIISSIQVTQYSFSYIFPIQSLVSFASIHVLILILAWCSCLCHKWE